VRLLLRQMGWRVLTVWECSIRICRHSISDLADIIVSWLVSSSPLGEIRC
jgi:G:T-mismatch repair DNA endonuclease (very short patch repair protein)